jgi:hypothetical protein
VVVREYPDRVEFSFNTIPGEVTWLYWREAYYPNWHAHLKDGSEQREIQIYRGGPGFMLMPIETISGDASLILTWETSVIEKASGVVSLFGIFLILGMLLDGLLFSGNGFTWIKIATTMWLPKPFLDEEVHAEKNNHGLRSVTGDKGGQHEPASAASELTAPAEESGIDERMKGEHTDLYRSWMESTGHTDDDWVNKILGQRKR